MKKRFISAILTLSMAAGYLFSVPVVARAASFSGGSGTESNPYLISTAADMWKLAEESNTQDYKDTFFKMTADIDLGCSESKQWTPIASSFSGAFAGTFDGDGHTVTGLYINNDEENQGLFQYVNGGSIKNLTVEGNITAQTAAMIVGGAIFYELSIDNCCSKGSVTATGKSAAGICLPYMCFYSPKLTNCRNEANVTGGIMNGESAAAGIITRNAIIKNCVNTGNISGVNYVGGIIGGDQYATCEVEGCVNTGRVKGTGSEIGGIAGHCGFGYVKKSYNTGSVSGSSCVGGISGTFSSSTNVTELCYNTGNISGSSKVGGISGTSGYESKYYNCYNLGDISATGDGAGGILGVWYGFNPDGEASKFDCLYNMGKVTSDTNYGAIIGQWHGEKGHTANISNAISLAGLCDNNETATIVTDAQLASASTYSGWADFNSNWELRSGVGRPILKNPCEAVTISNGDELMEFAEDVRRGNSFNRRYVELTDDIDLDGYDWIPIGKYDDSDEDSRSPFKGVFNGNGHTISNLLCEAVSEPYQGLFGYVGENGVVRNLTIDESCSFSGGEHTASIAGINVGTIENCKNFANVVGDEYTGGIVGENTKSNGSKGLVTKCYNAGEIECTESEAGGIVGFNFEADISQCANDGNVTSDVSYAGGIAGQNHTGTVTDCYSTGEIRSTRAYGGGVAGQSVGKGAKISNCYSYGRVYSYQLYGGVAGNNTDGSVIQNCYYLEDTARGGINSADASGSAQKLTKTQFANQSSFSGWDFNSIWIMVDKPYLDFAVSLKGSGTENDPYLINNTFDLLIINYMISKNKVDNKTHFLMTDDIDLEGDYFKPIGYANPFTGIFDGGGHTINTDFNFPGLTDVSNFGIFKEIRSGTVKNLNVEGDMTAPKRGTLIGGIAGYLNSGTIENCSFAGNISKSSSIDSYVGGIAGQAYNSVIKNCSFEGKISANITVEEAAEGGIAGCASGSRISNSCVSGHIEGGYRVGGIAGYWRGGITNDIVNCYSTGSVKSKAGGGYASGIVGYLNMTGSNGSFNIKSSYSTATLTGTNKCALAGNSQPAVEKSYYLKGIGTGCTGATEKTEEQFASGEVAYLLQSGQSEQVWGQSITGYDTDETPVFTTDEDKIVHKITCSTKSNANYATAYGTSEGVSSIPSYSGSGFIGWSLTNSANGKLLTEDTPITKDITVYALSQELYSEADGDKTIRVDYGKGTSVDLSQYVVYQKGTSTKGKYTYTINSGNITLRATISGDTLTIPASAPVGTHNLSVTATEKTPNFSLMSADFDNVPATMNITVIIGKRDASVTAPKAKTLTYNAAEQELVTAGTTNGGTLMYSLDGKTYSQSIPKGTNAGSYTVYYRLDGGTEFNDIAAKTVTVSIAKKKAELAIPQPSAAVYGIKLSAITLPSGWKWSDGQIVPTVKNSGYEAVYTVSDTANYDWSGVSGYNSSSNTIKRTVPVMITKATPVVTPPAGKILKTTGEMQELIYAGKTTAGTLVYSLNGANYSADIPKAKDKGNYTVYYKVIGDDNYNDTDPQTITAELGKADIPEDKITYPKAKTWLGYDGKEQELIYAGKVEDIEGARFLYSLDNKTFSEELPKAVNAGTYMVYYKLDGGEMYNDVPVRVTYASIEKQDAMWYVFAKVAGLFENFYNQDLTYGIKLSDIKLNNDFEWVDGSIIPEVDYAYPNGYPVIMHTENEDNYDWDGIEGFDREKHIWRRDLPFQMKKADITDITEPQGRELTYTGYAQELMTRGSAKGGSYVYSLDGEEYSDTVPTGTNAGEYTVYYKVAGDSNHNDTAAKSVKVTVAKKAPEFKSPENLKTVVYGAKLSEISLPKGWSWTDADTVPTVKNSGFEAKIKIEYDANYDWESIEGYNAVTHTVTRTLEVKVNKAKSDAKVPEELTATYGDKLSDVELPSGWSWDNPEANVGNAGKHPFAAAYTPEDTDNYDGINANISIEVRKAEPIVTAPEARDVTYTGLAQEIVTAATTTGGTLMYSLDGDNYFTTVPKARNAGEYTVYYKVEEDGNYNGYDEHTVTATIKKAKLNNLAVQMPEWTAGNDAPEPIISGNVGGGAVTYAYKAKDAADSAYSVDKPNTDGEFTVRATVAETDNYNSAAITSDFTVREPEGAPIPNTLTYNSGEQELVAAENDKCEYSLDGNNFTSAIPKATEAGTYTVYYKIGKSSVKTLEATILPAAAKLDTPASPSQAFDYGTKLSAFTLDDGWSWKDGNAVPEVGNNVGYEAVYEIKDSKNYNWTDVEGYNAADKTVTRHITVKVNKVAPSYTPPTAKTLTYTGKTQELVMNGSTNDGEIFYITKISFLWTELDALTTSAPTGINAGEYTVTYKIRGDRNHTDTGKQSLKVTIAPAKAELSEPTLTSVTYGTKLSDISLPTGWSWEKGDTIPTVNNSGYNAVYDTTQAALDSNHTWECVEGYNQDTKKITRKLSLTVNKATPAPEKPTNLTASYGNKLSDVKLPVRWSWDNPDANVGNVGKHLFAVSYTPEDTDNYVDLYTNISIEVRKADPIVTAPEAKDVTYNGLVQEIVTAAKTTGGTILYSVDQANYFTAVPKGRNAGEYTVYYKVEGDGNYNDSVEQTVTANIKKAKLNNLSVQMPEWTAGNDAPEPIISGNVGGGEVTYEYKEKDADDSAYTETKPADAGNYTIRATVAETANYEGASAVSDFIVYEAEGAPVANILNYDGREQELVTAENDGFVYSLDNETYSADIPTATNAGTYTVYYKIGEGSENTLDVTISPAMPSLTEPESSDSVAYGKHLSEIPLTEGWTWANGDTVPEVGNNEGYEAIYSIRTDEEDESYKNFAWSNIEGYDEETLTIKRMVSVNITKADMSVTLPTANTRTYNGAEQELVTAGSANGGQMLYSLNGTDFTTNVPTAVDANTYTVYYKAVGDANHNDVATENLTATILPKEAELTEPATASVTYGIKLSEIPLADGWNWKDGETAPEVTNSGYEAEYTVTPDSNYTWADTAGYDSSTSKVTRTIPLTVTKVDPNPEIPTELTATYGDTLSKITLPEGWAWSNTDESVGSAGTHTFAAVFTPKDTNNYSLYNADLTVEVAKATPTVTEPAANDLTYNGEAHELVSAAETTGGTLLYSLDGENYFTAVPKARNAGNYTVYYKVEDDANYYGIDAATVEANIAKAAITPTVSMPEWTVGGAAPEPVLTGNIGGGEVTYKYKEKDAEDSAYSDNKPVDAGKYTIQATIAATTNYNEAIVTADFTVFKAAGAPVARYLTYDGKAQKLVTAENDGFVYSLDGETFNSEIPEETNAGTYTVYFKIGQSSVQTLYVTIAPAMPEFNNPESSGSFVYGKHLYEIPLTEGWTWADGNIVPDVNNHGYEAVYSIRQDEEDESYKNYTWSNIEGYDEESLTVTRMVDLTVTKANAELTLPKVKMRTYTGAEQELITAGSARGGQILYSLDNETYTTNIPMGVDANTYTVYYKVVGDSNHNDSEVSNLTVTIFPKDAELTEPGTAGVTYGTKLSDIELPEGWEWSDKNTVPKVTNSGYAAKYTVTENQNYTWERISGYDSETGTVTRTLPVTVNKSNEAPEIPSSLTATYGDTLSAVSLPEGWAWKNGDTNVGNAGTHAFAAVYTPSDTDNYESLEREVAITVEKALPEMTEPEIKTLIYTGANQELITAAETDDGTVLYSLDGAAYSTAVPSGKSAGDYKVYYKVKGDENHLDSEPETVNAAIEKADIQLEVNMLSRSIDEEPSNPMVYGNTGNGTVTYKYKPKNSADSAYSEFMPNTQGAYKVSATVAETNNYNSASAETEFVILPSWSSREYSLMFIDNTLLVTAPHSGPCTVIFAAYKNGVLQNVYTEEKIFEGEGMDIAVMPEELTAGEPDEIRAMLWSGLADMAPLCQSVMWRIGHE